MQRNESDGKRFTAVVEYLSLNFPEREMSRRLLESYFSDLSDFDIDDIEKAAKAYVRTGDMFPLVSDLIRLLSSGGDCACSCKPSPGQHPSDSQMFDSACSEFNYSPAILYVEKLLRDKSTTIIAIDRARVFHVTDENTDYGVKLQPGKYCMIEARVAVLIE